MAVPLPPMRRMDAVRRSAVSHSAATDASFASFARDRLQTIAADYSFRVPFVCVCDEAGRFHCADGPAVMPSLSDNQAAYVATPRDRFYWHGVEVPSYVIMNPSVITVTVIDDTPNIEVRRAMMDRFGMQRYFSLCAAELVHEDTFGKLYRKAFNPFSESFLCFVRVRNATAEPDGSIKEYFLRVPPDMRTAQEAVAWTFGIEGDWAAAYAPSVET